MSSGPLSSVKPPCPSNYYHVQQAQLICFSYKHWTGHSLLKLENPMDGKLLFEAPFVVVSHGVESDPIFNYGNRLALSLFRMKWPDFVSIPSRLSAEASDRCEREKLLSEVAVQGYSHDYKGMRVSSTGERFEITDASIWNLIDEKGTFCGQAACFDKWTML